MVCVRDGMCPGCMCPGWYVSGMVCVRDGMCPGWYVSGMVCVRDGMCPGWYVSGMVCVRDGMCPGWYVSGMVCVRDGMCPGWYVSGNLYLLVFILEIYTLRKKICFHQPFLSCLNPILSRLNEFCIYLPFHLLLLLDFHKFAILPPPPPPPFIPPPPP